MKKRNLLLIFLSIMLALGIGFSHKNNNVTLASSMSPYTVTLYSSDNGVSTGEANTVLQTKDGFIWVGGYGGLQRFDGKNFVSFGKAQGMTSNAIRALYEAEDGTLWVGSNEQGVFYYKDGVFTKIISDKHLSVRCISEADGHIFVGSSEGLAYIENNTLQSVNLEYAGEVFNTTVYTLSLDRWGKLWGVDYNGSLFAVDTNTLEVTDRIWNEGVYAYSAFVASDDTIYVGTNTTTAIVYKRTGDNGETLSKTTYNTGKLSAINSICENDGEIWMCGDTGIGRIVDGTFEDLSYLGNASFLVNIISDYEHNLWVASKKYGVLNIRREKVSRFVDTNSSLNDKEAYTICNANGQWYVGAENGLFVYDENWDDVTCQIATDLGGKHIHKIIKDGNKLYIGTYYYGLYIYDLDAKTYSVIPASDFSGNRIRDILRLQNGDIAVATNYGVDILRGGAIYSSCNLSGLVLCLLELEDGTLLAGSDGSGIFKITGTTYTKYADIENGLSGGVILRMVEDTTSQNIFVSCGDDVFYGNSSSGFTMTTAITSGSGSIVDIFLDNDVIWLFRASGIIKCKKVDFISGNAKELEYISKEDGLPGTIIANAWSLYEDGVFVVCTANGIGVLDTKNMYINSIKPKVSISVTMSDGSVWDGSKTINLDKNLSKITFGFSALTYDGATAEFWLEGFDDNVITRDISSQNEVEYTNLKKGTYYFHLRVLNADGTASDEIVLTIIKEPKFVETVWFNVMILLAVVFAVALITLLIIVRAKRKQKLYKRMTDQSIATISGVIDAKDPYTNGHSLRVAEFAVKIAKRMGLKKADCERLNYIALLHDIGKIGVPDKILNKPERLTDEEFSEIKHHVDVGGEVLSNFTMLKGVTEGALYHHERYDGSGYSQGLKGEEIPLFARIIAVADSYDAMNSSRCYRPAMDIEKIKAELIKGKGTQFDPKIVDVAIEVINDEIKEKSK